VSHASVASTRASSVRKRKQSARDRSRLYRQREEHLQLLDLIDAGRRVEAARMLREHLDVVGTLKTGGDPGRVARRSGARDVGAIEVHL